MQLFRKIYDVDYEKAWVVISLLSPFEHCFKTGIHAHCVRLPCHQFKCEGT